ncbi:hypothetical protein LINGRAHAP2_LOCUS11711 [Linum grandiflorum]
MSSRRKQHQLYTREAAYPLKKREIIIAGPSQPIICVRFGSQKICSDNVDAVAEEFIKLKHRKFEASKTMPVNYG